MSIEAALYARITSQVSALGSRLYPIELPPNTQYPAATYQFNSGRSVQSHDRTPSGASAFDSVTITVLAGTRVEALAVRAAIQAAIEPGRWSEGTVSVYSCWKVDSFDLERDSLARIEGVAHVFDIMHS